MIKLAIGPLIFIPVLLYPPLLFTDKITASLRIGLFISLIIYLYLATKRFQKNDYFIFFLLIFLLSSLLTVNFGNLDGLRTVGSVMLTLVFAYALSRAAEMNDRIKKNLAKFYINIFILVPLGSLMSVIYFLIFGEFNLFNIYSEGYNYLYTPFGVMLEKDFFGFHVYRSHSFFIEPVYLALFYAANIFMVAPYLKEKSSYFLAANVIGGFLTFSYLFFVLSALLFLTTTTTIFRKYALRPLLMVCLITILPIVDFFSASSLSDRSDRLDLFFIAMEETNTLQFMFGRGFIQYTGFNKHFSAGLLSAIYEVGIINLVVIMLFLVILSNKRKHIFLLFFIAMLVFEPTKLPLFWMLLVMLSFLLPDKHHIKSTSISQCSSLVSRVDS